MEGQRILVTEENVRDIEKDDTFGYRFTATALIVTAILLMFLAPSPEAFAVAAVFIALVIIWHRYRKKRGPLKVYFMRKQVTEKYVATDTGDGTSDASTYYLYFGKRSCTVQSDVYHDVNVGDWFYVMYDTYNDRPKRCYEAARYDLDPSLDFRTESPEVL